MTVFRRIVNTIAALLRWRRVEAELDEELRAYYDTSVAEKMRAGMSRTDAMRAARLELGSMPAVKDRVRDVGWESALEGVWQDVRYAVRLLRKSPAFSVAAVLTLGLAIGANTAIFSLVDAVLMKSLPVHDPQQLVFVDSSGGKSGGTSGPPYPCYELLRDNTRFLAGIAAFDSDRVKVTIDGIPEQISVQYASGSYFDVLGVPAIHGRVLVPDDDSVLGRGGPNGAAAVISHSLWQRRFALDPAVIGKTIQVGTHWAAIVGVTPPEFLGLQVGSPIDITVPMMLAGNSLRSRALWFFSVVGRIKPGATADQARADLDGLYDRYMTALGQPREKRDYFNAIELVPAGKGLNGLRRQFSQPLLIVMAIVAIVLLVGCTNVANLLLARAGARQNEIAVRLAIGASRLRLIRQLLTEGALLASLGALAGLLFARWAMSFLTGFLAGRGGDILLDPRVDVRVLAFTALTTAITVLIFGLAPALSATRVDAAKPGSTGAISPSRPRVRLGQALVVVQVMLSLALVSGAALFLRTLYNLNSVEAGFRREGVLTMLVETPAPPRPSTPPARDEVRQEHARLGASWEEFIAAVNALPGVTSAAVATMSPLTGRDRGVLIALDGDTAPPDTLPDRYIHINQVTAGYFETMGVRLLAGRTFTPRDGGESPRVAILNQSAARAYFGGADAIGQRVSFPGQRVEDAYEVVGIVSDSRYETLRKPDERMAYLPIEQSIDPIRSAMTAVRGPGDITGLVPAIRTAARSTMPDGFVSRIATIDQQLQASLVGERLLSILASFFGGLALALACIGLYGILAYGVMRRSREIAVRMAIGARAGSVIRLVLGEMVALVLLGAALGSIVAIVASRYVQNQLFGVAPGDPAAMAAAVLLLFAVAAVAGYLPARRAARVDPLIALRCE